MNGYPGIDTSVLTYGRDRMNDILAEADGIEGMDLTVRTFGYRLDQLTLQSSRVA